MLPERNRTPNTRYRQLLSLGDEMNDDCYGERNHRSAMHPKHGRRPLLAFEQNDAQCNCQQRKPSGNQPRNGHPLEDDLQRDMRYHHPYRAKAKEAVVFYQKLHDGLIGAAKGAILWQLHHPIAIAPLDEEI